MRFSGAEKIADVVKAIEKLASGRLCSPTVTQYAIKPALEGSKAFLKNFVQELRRRRNYATERIKSIKRLRCDIPAAAFYLMLQVDGAGVIDEQFALQFLQKTGMLLVHGSGFGLDPSAGYYRLVYLANEEIL